MRSIPSPILAAAAACLAAFSGFSAQAQLPLVAGLAPVALQYSCPAQTGSLPVCSTNFTIPYNKLLVIQNISGSATPIAPNAAGTFATGQASLTVTTQLDGEAAIPNIVGPNYALANTAVWFFNTQTTLSTTKLPVVMNNGGPVLLQGYVIEK